MAIENVQVIVVGCPCLCGGERVISYGETETSTLKIISPWIPWPLLQALETRRTADCSQCNAYSNGMCQRCWRCSSPKYTPCVHCDFEIGRAYGQLGYSAH